MATCDLDCDQIRAKYIQGEHKKVSPPTTFVDISAMRGDLCMKFYKFG